MGFRNLIKNVFRPKIKNITVPITLSKAHIDCEPVWEEGKVNGLALYARAGSESLIFIQQFKRAIKEKKARILIDKSQIHFKILGPPSEENKRSFFISENELPRLKELFQNKDLKKEIKNLGFEYGDVLSMGFRLVFRPRLPPPASVP